MVLFRALNYSDCFLHPVSSVSPYPYIISYLLSEVSMYIFVLLDNVNVLTPALTRSFLWSLNHRKSPHFSRTFRRIVTKFNNVLISKLLLFYSLRVFHICVSWSFSTRVWVTASPVLLLSLLLLVLSLLIFLISALSNYLFNGVNDIMSPCISRVLLSIQVDLSSALVLIGSILT